MTLYVTEAEMKERFTDSLKKSASKAKEFTEAELNKKPQIFVEFIDGLKIAAGSAHQLAHSQENPKWLQVRDILEKIIDVGQILPTFSSESSPLWIRIKDQLEAIAIGGEKLATSAAMPRYEVLSRIEDRLKNLPNLKETLKDV